MNFDFPVLDFAIPRTLSPTDIGNFGRLEGCERFLRLRLHTTNRNADWLEESGLRKQTIPPLLTFSGRDFEEEIEAQLGITSTAIVDGDGPSDGDDKPANANARLLDRARDLMPGETFTDSQVSLEVVIEDWAMRGVIDLLRLSRDENDGLHVLIADMKASQRAKVEHRLQLAFYYRMIEALFGEGEVEIVSLKFGVLYRGPGDLSGLSPEDAALLAQHRAAARAVWSLDDYYYEGCDEEQTYLNSLKRLVFDADSQARAIAAKPFENVEYHLTKKCDTCVFAEFCLKSSAQSQNLSLLPYLTSVEKGALIAGGIENIPDLAALKTPRESVADADDPRGWNELQTVTGCESKVAKLAGDRQVGARLDELIHRAHAFLRVDNRKSYIPSRGEGTLPYVTPEVNSNIVRIYLDGGLDYVNNRAYMLGARFVAYREGAIVGERTVVELAEKPPTQSAVEADLIRAFFGRAQGVAAQLANEAEYIDEDGVLEFAAPVHVTFFDRQTQQIWLEAMSRHLDTLMACAPVFDFLKQLPSGDSFVVSTLDAEARQLKNYPLLAPSLQILARYLKFDWGDSMARFRRGLFDDGSTLDDEITWYTARSRFLSQIPLEYAYGAWGVLPPPRRRDDLFKSFRDVSEDELIAFCEQRLCAIEHIGAQFRGNTKTTIRPYELDSLLDFQVKEPTFVDALQTFLQMERLAELGQWKAARHAPPERRMLSGDSLVVCYREADQNDETRAQNTLNHELLEKRAAYKEEHRKTSDKRVSYPDEMSSKLIDYELTIRLRIETAGCDCSLGDAIGLSTTNVGDWVWLHERQTVDGRLPEAERVKFHPTVRQLLIFSKNATVVRAPYVDENGDGWVEVKPDGSMGSDGHNFTFGGQDCTFEDGETYSLDPNPNDWSGSACFKQHEKIAEGEPNFMHDLLSGQLPNPQWPAAAHAGQTRFLQGLKQLGDAVFAFEPSKEDYIGAHGGAPMLLVQGPPGTGKTYATAFALLARLQGAMAAGIPWRGLISAHTHNAVNVALKDVYLAQRKLSEVRDNQPALFAEWFDTRLLEVPLFRLQGTATDWDEYDFLTPLWATKKEAEKYESEWLWPREALAVDYCLAGAVPMGARKVWDADKKQSAPYFNALIVDEASQMNQPLACLASVAHSADSTLIVVGDPRQMPPITKPQWENESHRVFAGQPAFESLYGAIAARGPVVIKFEESFRLHARMAQFLREAIYHADGINYHSNKTRVLPAMGHSDDFAAAVLAPDHPIVLIEHDEAASILENSSESNILRPILERLTDADLYALDVKDGLGIVVPHRAQRALLGDERWKVDTVERFQGDQRRVMAFSATESDPLYLLHNGGFLLDPRRLCVSLSRAKEKLILVAAKSVFDLVPLDEETFLNAQLWQKLRHEFCVEPLWQGAIGGTQVRVLGSGLG